MGPEAPLQALAKPRHQLPCRERRGFLARHRAREAHEVREQRTQHSAKREMPARRAAAEFAKQHLGQSPRVGGVERVPIQGSRERAVQDLDERGRGRRQLAHQTPGKGNDESLRAGLKFERMNGTRGDHDSGR